VENVATVLQQEQVVPVEDLFGNEIDDPFLDGMCGFRNGDDPGVGGGDLPQPPLRALVAVPEGPQQRVGFAGSLPTGITASPTVTRWTINCSSPIQGACRGDCPEMP
jgi:hypothetical protein